MLSTSSIEAVDLQLGLAGVGCLNWNVCWVGRQEWLALLLGCFTQGRQPHRVANPSTAPASCVFNSMLTEAARRCQTVQVFCLYLHLMSKCPKTGRQFSPCTMLLMEGSVGSVYFPVFCERTFGFFPF